LRELASLSGVEFSKEMAENIAELCRLKISPVAIVSVLKSLQSQQGQKKKSDASVFVEKIGEKYITHD
jgi:uncharacterized protein (DUF169 family)